MPLAIESLFVQTLDDLHSRINSGDEYQILRASLLIRQLLLDGRRSLVDQVNRIHRQKLSFTVAETKTAAQIGLPDSVVWCDLETINPDIAPAHFPRVQKTRHEFLSIVLGSVRGKEYSVADVVRTLANVLGGVHAGTADEEREKAVEEVHQSFSTGGVSFAARQMITIGRIVLHSLSKLKLAALRLERFENSSGISVHLVVSLLPMEEEEQCYIVDIGTEVKRNRISIFLDDRGTLTFRLILSDGTRHQVRAGEADCAYRYGEWTHLSFEIGILEDEILLRVEAGGWSHTKVLPRGGRDFQLHGQPFVIGSDIIGKANTHMALAMKGIILKYPTESERSEIAATLFQAIRDREFSKSLLFKGNQFLHSANHPHLPKRQEHCG